tara:strand:- start:460 stop:4806 length:4347 start_codon:yes stop_codon:yes gene_type:complete
MVLAQDQAQANEGMVLDQRRKQLADEKAAEVKYQNDLAQHKEDVIKWEKKVADEAKAAEVKYQNDLAQHKKDLVAWEKQKISIEAENKIIVATETKKRTDAKTAEDKRVAGLNAAEDKRVAELKSKDDKLVATAVSFVKADQKAKADIALKAETKRLAELAVKEEKQRAKQEVIDKNKEFFDSGQRFYDSNHAVHYATIQGVPIDHKSEVKYYAGGTFTQAYYERAGKHFGITTEEAFKVSQAGRMSGSGKTRDQMLRSFQDPTGGLESQYQSHRALAKKTTASAYGKIAADQAEAESDAHADLFKKSGGLIGKEKVALDINSNQSLVGTNVKAPKGSYIEQIESARRQQRTIDLREGNVGIATALLEPVTANTYTNTSGRVDALTLTKTFLTERGYDLNNLDAVPDSVFKEPVKYVEARKQTTETTMGDLTKLIPPQPTMYETKKVGTAQVGVTLNEYYKKIPNTELVKRTEARERLEAIGRPVMPVNEYRQGNVQGPVQAKYEVTIGDKVRIFNSLESAEKFSARMNPEQWSVTYDVPTKIPTMTGSSVGSKTGMLGTTVLQLPVTKTFDSKEEAQTFIDNKQSNLPYTQDSKLLPMEKMYSGYDKFAKDAYQKAKDHVGMESSWMYEGGAAMASLGADMLNVVTVGGDLLDKHVLNRTVTPKQPITTIPTYYDKGTEKALEGIKITKTGVTGIPSINPLDENNIVSKWYQGASQQWGKQTTAQNIGQSAVAVPIALFDVITLGQAGAGVVRKLAPVLSKTATKVTPVISKTITKIGGTRLVTKVMEAPLNVKTSGKKYPTAIDQSSPYATADNFPSKPDIDRSMSGDQLLESLKMKGVNAAGNQSDVILVKGKKASPTTQLDPDYKPTGRANEIDYTDNIDGFGERVKDVSGARFISPKPTLNLRVGTFKKQTVEMGEQIGSIERNPINVGGRNVYGFTKQTVSLPRSATTKVSKGERFNRPNYDRASSEFADFQKGLDGTPKRYTQSFTSTKVRLTDRYNLGTPVTQRLKGVGNYGAEQFKKFQAYVSPSINVVGSIKFSKGFVPGKQTRQYKPFKPKEVAEEYAYKADGKIGNLLSDTVSHSPLTVRTTKPDKIARLPKTGKAPTIGKEKYIEGIDFQPAKTPKGKNAPIGYEAPKPKPKPNTGYFSNMKSTKKNLDLTKSEPPRSRETGNSQVLLPPAPKPPKTKKKASTGPTDPLLDVTITDSPLPTEKSKNSFLILPPVIKPQTDKEKNKPKQVVIPRVIQTVTTSQIPVIKTQQKKIIKSSVTNTQKITQVQPQKIKAVQPQKIKAVQPQKLIQVIPQKSVQKIRQRQYLSQPTAPKPVARQTVRPMFKLKAPQRVAQRTPNPTPARKPLAFVFPTDSSKPRKERKRRKSKGKDFLGSSRTDNIVGMFNRNAIISGDKASAKQLRIDKKYKEKKRRSRNKLKKKSLMQKEGIFRKGFKI